MTTMYGIEYLTEGVDSTFEIFTNYTEALMFANSNENALYMFKADFNDKFIYKELGYWNYEDNSELYNNLETIEIYEVYGE